MPKLFAGTLASGPAFRAPPGLCLCILLLYFNLPDVTFSATTGCSTICDSADKPDIVPQVLFDDDYASTPECLPCPPPAKGSTWVVGANFSEQSRLQYVTNARQLRSTGGSNRDYSSESCSNTIASELTGKQTSTTARALMSTLLDLTGHLPNMLSRREDLSKTLAVFVPSDWSLEAAGYGLGGLLMSGNLQDVYKLARSHIVRDMRSSGTKQTSGFNSEGDKIQVSSSNGSDELQIIPNTQSEPDANRKYDEDKQQIIRSSEKCNGMIYYIGRPLVVHTSLAMQMDESTNRKNQYPNTTTAPQSTVPPPTQAPDVSTQPQQPEIPSTQRPDAPQFAAEQSKDAASESACKCYHDSNAGGNAPGSVPGGCRKHRPDAYPFCYVAGTTACSRAAASASFPGEAWRNCNPETEGGREAAASVNPCSCTTNQDSGGVEVPGGCGQFLAASSEYYCYVTGSTGCEAATASSNFPGAGWRKCEPSDIPDCQCSADGASNGVYTGRAGCGLHHENAEAPYCYTTGGNACPFGLKSQAFPGSTWRFC